MTVPIAWMGRRSLLATEMVLKGGLPSVIVVRSESDGTTCFVQPPSMIHVGSGGEQNRAQSVGMRQRASCVVMISAAARVAECRHAHA